MTFKEWAVTLGVLAVILYVGYLILQAIMPTLFLVGGKLTHAGVVIARFGFFLGGGIAMINYLHALYDTLFGGGTAGGA